MPLDDSILKRLRSNDATLLSLELYSSQIDYIGVKKLAAALAQNNVLQTLGLECSKIGDKGVKRLAYSLAKNAKLSSLNL